MRILIDMDGVIANWGATFDRYLDLHADGLLIPRSAYQKSFNLKEGLNAEQSAVIDLVMDIPGFYAEIDPMPGAQVALNQMLAVGHDVAIVTSPWLTNPTCIADKIAWVDTHLGAGWATRLIITKDKTRIGGDILIDDKPEVEGAIEPSWEHIHFEQPYNTRLGSRRVLRTWENWESLIGPALPAEPNTIIRVRHHRIVRLNDRRWRVLENNLNIPDLMNDAELLQHIRHERYEIVGLPAQTESDLSKVGV